METGEKAKKEDLNAIVSITAGEMLIPHGIKVFDRDGNPSQVLDAIQELDCIHGFCSHIYNLCYPGNQ
jgi:hypothetical protein